MIYYSIETKLLYIYIYVPTHSMEDKQNNKISELWYILSVNTIFIIINLN